MAFTIQSGQPVTNQNPAGQPNNVNPYDQTISQFTQPASAFTTGIATSLTPQNNYQANAPLDVNALSNQVLSSQNNFNANYANQNALAQALLAQSQGQGPNPAQSLYNQNVNSAIMQNQGMLNSQKGINPALAARLGAENAASMSQNAAGQSSVLNAEQQLGAQNSLQNLLNGIGTQQNQNIATTGGLANQSGLGAQGINAGVSAQNAAANQNTFGGFMNGMMSQMPNISSMMSKGGTVQRFDDGGGVFSDVYSGMGNMSPDSSSSAGAATSMFGNNNNSQVPNSSTPMIAPSNVSNTIAGSILAQGGVPVYPAGNPPQPKSSGGGGGGGSGIMSMLPMLMAMMSKGGKVVPPHLLHVAAVYHPDFGAKNTEQLRAQGGKVPGKAKVQGDSPKNDTVKTLLSPGELVIPRTIMNSKDPVKEGANFIAQELAKGHGKDKSEFHAALKTAMGSRSKNAS